MIRHERELEAHQVQLIRGDTLKAVVLCEEGSPGGTVHLATLIRGCRLPAFLSRASQPYEMVADHTTT